MKLLKNFRWVCAIGLILICLTFLVAYYLRMPSREIGRARLDTMIQAKQIHAGVVTPTAYAGIYRVDGESLPGGKRFSITTHLDESQVKALSEQPSVKFEIPGAGMKGQWINIISTLLIAGTVIFLVVHQASIGKGKNSKVKSRPETRFADVAGIEEAKAEVSEVVDFLREPKKYKKLGGKLPKGVLLIGPPGTGKTMLAKAIAGEANAHFFSVHASDFNEVFVGVGAKRVRQLFKQAAKHKPAIIFIDELDCVGKNRKFDSHGEHQQTINALLAAMDGFENGDGIVVVAATNRPEDLDDALTRPGRFDRKVHVPFPDRKGRRAILQVHVQEKPIENLDRALDTIAQTTPGMSGADLANLLNEASIQCAQNNATKITLADLETARDKVRFGKERPSMLLKQKEREMVAYHEAGHAIINLQKPLLPPLYKVSIIPRGQSLGSTTLLPDEDQNLYNKDFLLQQLVVLMGGRAAEKTFYGATTNGATGDLQMARDVAQKMIHDWGMGERLYYERDKQDAELEINRLLENADREALTLIAQHKENTEKLAKELLVRETVTRDEVLALIN